MASRVARTAIGAAARARPTLPLRTAVPAISSVRAQSSVPQKDPKDAAKSILDALPGSNLVSKTAILSAGAGLSVAAISNELYVVNEESIVMLSLLSVFFAVAKYGGPMYSEWAAGQHEKIKGILNTAREDHTSAVKERINSVKDLSGVIDVTKDLFAVSKVRNYPRPIPAETGFLLQHQW
ncbi:hypothetical protein K431DRAFT_283239 [Polychaeton citri CBS 116435]|uniref:ATP synthase subunit 4 n=1 Tax=Polychaeton citri CBS 116435 TaxID=1314669 RepID=A0A9P4UQP4_9PEZI|nr:hypothetical protein K431DRAFT_283239 [Polychaeton citri CBS 116435]